MKKSDEVISRRQLIKGAAALTTAGALFPQIVPRRVVGGKAATPPSETLNVAAIGLGLMGANDVLTAKRAGSNFDYAGPLTEIAVLGNIAQHTPGTELEWDAKHMTFPNAPKANQYLHFRYRDGWTL